MFKRIRRIALQTLAICSLSLSATVDTTSNKQVYSITPNNAVIEYRPAFVREHKKTEVTHYGRYDSSVSWNDAKEVTVGEHFPAGFYYVGTSKRYNIPVGRHIVYSVVDAGPNGEAQRVLVWSRASKVSAEIVARDTEEHRDEQFLLTAALALIGGALGRWLRGTYRSTSVGASIGAAVGYSAHPHLSETRLVDQQYMSKASQKRLLEQMKAAGDDRVADDQRKNITTDDYSYVLEAILDISHIPGKNAPHLDHFIVQRLGESDVSEVVKEVVTGNHAAKGSLGYKLPNEIDTYSGRQEKFNAYGIDKTDA